ncbi:hypothetical protein KY329_00165 [Candidatus Woesearchaeota archaeon]|nr:hypothetical protein [Candidatus Woesearchaeota archaeon]
MVTHENEFEKFPKTQAYVDFGLEQVEAINARFRDWLSKQSFADGAAPSEYVHMKVGGTVNHSEYNDAIRWELEFPEKTGKLGDVLLHEHRYPVQVTFNAKPDIFSSVSDIQIRVHNGEKGWVEEGAFPQNIRDDKDYDAYLKKPRKPFPLKPIQTDVRREALAGFEAAYHWQCYRAMAVTCCDFLLEMLKRECEELDEISKTMDRTQKHEAQDSMRDRREITRRLFVEALPDIGLPSVYRPGTLETALALEIQNATAANHGPHDLEKRPIWYPKATPTQIVATPAGYDALMSLNLSGFSYDEDKDEKATALIVEQLGKHFDVEFAPKRHLLVSFKFPDAHTIADAIREGSTDTLLHRRVQDFCDALRETNAVSRIWYKEDMPVLEANYRQRVDEARAKRLSFDFKVRDPKLF